MAWRLEIIDMGKMARTSWKLVPSVEALGEESGLVSVYLDSRAVWQVALLTI